MFLALLTAATLAACGGDDSGKRASSAPATPTAEDPTLVDYQRLRTESFGKLAEVQSLVSTSPCTQSSQCATLVLRPQFSPCISSLPYDYSLASPTAGAAGAAADAFNQLSAQAHAIEPPSNISGSCFENVNFTPLNCVANKCVRQYVFDPPASTGPQPEGIWASGTLQLFVSFVNLVWAVDTSAGTPTIYTGPLAQQGTNLTATLTRISGAAVSASSLVATIADSPSASISIDSLDGLGGTPLKLDPVTGFFSPSALSQVAGSYTLSSGERIVVDANGAVRSADQGCTIAGSVQAPWSDRNVYYLGFVFGPAPCKNPNAFIEGILAPLPGGQLFVAVKRQTPDVAALSMTRVVN